MSYVSPSSLWSRLADFLAEHTGLGFGPDRHDDLRRAMVQVAREFGFRDSLACGEWLLSAPPSKAQIDVLVGLLTVGETYFFRHPRSFEILEQDVFPALLAARRGGLQTLRVWSAGCCTGEEPYSLAILLTRLIPDWQQWQITILATDINAGFLQQAAAGVFREWSFRDASLGLKEDFFRPLGGGQYEIRPHLKRLVSFSYLNLASDSYPSLLNNTNAMDVILCRNVLMYFTPTQARRVVQQLQRCLVPGGWMMCSPAESLYLIQSDLKPVNFPGFTAYRQPEVFAPQLSACRVCSTATMEHPPAPACTAAGESSAGVPPGQPSQPPSDGYDQALRLYRQGRYAEARDCLQIALGHHPEDAKTLELLVRVYADQGQLQEAAAWSERSIAADRLNAGAYYLRATILQEQGAVEDAVQSLNRALYLDSDFVLAHFALGSLALGQGALPAADKHFSQALRLLETYRPDEPVPESDGVTSGRLREIILAMSTYRGRQTTGKPKGLAPNR